MWDFTSQLPVMYTMHVGISEMVYCYSCLEQNQKISTTMQRQKKSSPLEYNRAFLANDPFPKYTTWKPYKKGSFLSILYFFPTAFSPWSEEDFPMQGITMFLEKKEASTGHSPLGSVIMWLEILSCTLAHATPFSCNTILEEIPPLNPVLS